MSRLTATAARLTDGSRILANRYTTRLTSWVRKARRDDLTGTRAALGPLLRIAVLTWAVYQLLRLAPWMLWPLTAWWCWAAWRATRTEMIPQEQPAPPPDPDLETQRRAAFIHFLDTVTRGRPGIHLSDLYARLRERPALAHLTNPQLRAVLDRYGVPLKRTLRVGRVAGRTGVSRPAVEELLQTLGPATTPAAPHDHSPGPLSVPDQHESTDSPATLHPSPRREEGPGAVQPDTALKNTH